MEINSEPVMVVRVEEAQMDEMWSFVQSKKQQRWLWSAIDHRTGKMLAYVLAPHEDAALVKLKQLLNPFGLSHFYTDGWGAELAFAWPAASHRRKSQHSEDRAKAFDKRELGSSA